MDLGGTQTRFRAIDFFSGVGGFSLSAERAGFHVTDAFELDQFAVRAHKKNFPTCNTHAVDLSKVEMYDLQDLLSESSNEKLDLMIGGPPCQGFSEIGSRIVNDPRNSLFLKFFDFAKVLMPALIVVENVPGILHKQNQFYVERAYDSVREAYTMLPPLVIKGTDMGAPTTRQRVFFIGVRSDLDIAPEKNLFFSKELASVTVGEALQGLPVEIDGLLDGIGEVSYGGGWFAHHLRDFIPEGVGDRDSIEQLHKHGRITGMLPTKHSERVSDRYRRMLGGQRDQVSKAVKLKSDGYCPTLRAGTDNTKGSYQAVRPIHPDAARVITPREAARLQGFPDWFQFDKTIWHSFRQIGNSVSPIVGKQILSVLHTELLGVKK